MKDIEKDLKDILSKIYEDKIIKTGDGKLLKADIPKPDGIAEKLKTFFEDKGFKGDVIIDFNIKGHGKTSITSVKNIQAGFDKYYEYVSDSAILEDYKKGGYKRLDIDWLIDINENSITIYMEISNAKKIIK
jgi:hypothetical protein